MKAPPVAISRKDLTQSFPVYDVVAKPPKKRLAEITVGASVGRSHGRHRGHRALEPEPGVQGRRPAGPRRPNGCGKITLLRALSGAYESEMRLEGGVAWPVTDIRKLDELMAA